MLRLESLGLSSPQAENATNAAEHKTEKDKWNEPNPEERHHCFVGIRKFNWVTFHQHEEPGVSPNPLNALDHCHNDRD